MKNFPIAVFACAAMAACGQPEPKQTSQTAVPAMEDTLAQMPGGGPKQQSSTNEQLFRTTLAAFRTAATAGDHATLEKMIRFPLQTAPKWSDEDIRNVPPDTVSGKLTEKQYSRYKDNIFSPEIKSALEKENGEEIREIAAGSEDDYYSRLRAGVDSSAPLYEVYHQFPEKDGSPATYFAFIFGKVGPEYKLTGFYTKWPVRD
ncbi:hypothetical protein [Chitinophaga rhizosphaerae]|uniref:hypothetical protein n=1 Tax=Chitinophaga rhizosphaerae TaxID=1864947 RepID=UPI000F810D05|nr:hypothetical protein [Chitinophaga rhizosphaerae]